jgi:hypothetical protein
MKKVKNSVKFWVKFWVKRMFVSCLCKEAACSFASLAQAIGLWAHKEEFF